MYELALNDIKNSSNFFSLYLYHSTHIILFSFSKQVAYLSQNFQVKYIFYIKYWF